MYEFLNKFKKKNQEQFFFVQIVTDKRNGQSRSENNVSFTLVIISLTRSKFNYYNDLGRDDANLFHKYVYQYKIKSFNENEGLSIRRFKRACTVMTKKVNSHLIGSPMNGLEFDKHSRSCRVMISEVGLYF